MASLSCHPCTQEDLKSLAENDGNQLGLIRKFGQFSLPHLVETAFATLKVVDNTNGQIVGIASFNDTPPRGLGVSTKWHDWFRGTFIAQEKLMESKVLWLTFFRCDVDGGDFVHDLAEALLNDIFQRFPMLEGILALIPEGESVYTPVGEMFEEMPLQDEEYYGPRCYLCPRNFFVPSLTLRKAAIEDHDDLVPIFNEQSEILTNIYGEFFLAELIENKDPDHASIVAETNGHAIGLMTVTKDVDVKLIKTVFDLAPYDDLVPFTDDIFSEPEEEEEEEEEEEVSLYKNPAQRMASVFSSIEKSMRKGKKAKKDAADTFVGLPKQMVIGKLEDFVDGLDESGADEKTQLTANEGLDYITDGFPEDEPEEGEEKKTYPYSSTGIGDSEYFNSATFVDALLAYGCRIHDYPIYDFVKYFEVAFNVQYLGPDEEEVETVASNKSSRANSRRNSLKGSRKSSRKSSRATSPMPPEDVLQVDQKVEMDTLSVTVSSPSQSNSNSPNIRTRALTPKAVEAANATSSSPVPAVVVTEEDKSMDELNRNLDEHDPAADNVFAVSLFCLDTGFEGRSIDFLRPVFDLFPEREYCLLTQPHSSPETPLLSHFTLIPPKTHNSFPHVLYLLHRDSVYANVQLRWAEAEDLPSFHQLLEGTDNLEEMEKQVQDCIDHKAAMAAKVATDTHEEDEWDAVMQATDEEVLLARLDWAAFAITCEGEVVGLVVVETQRLIEDLRNHYAVEDYISLTDVYPFSPEMLKQRRQELADAKANLRQRHPKKSPAEIEEEARAKLARLPSAHCNLKHFVLNPLFQRQTPYLLREVLRLFHKEVIYHKLHEQDRVQSVLDYFRQVQPRRQPIDKPAEVKVEEKEKPFMKNRTKSVMKKDNDDATATNEDAKETAKLLGSNEFDCALHMVTRRLLSASRVPVNSRLVIVGASHCALSLLETMLTHYTHLNYSSIILVSEEALPTGRKTKSKTYFFPSDLAYGEQYMNALALETRVRVIQGRVEDLDTERCEITLNDGSVLPYANLVLTPGLQTQAKRICSSMTDVNDVHNFNTSVVSSPDEIQGVFSLCSDIDVDRFTQYRNLNHPRVIVVYGFCLEAFTVIRGLLDSGVTSSNIILVSDEPKTSDKWCFGINFVAEKILKTLHKLGVKMLTRVKLAQIGHEKGRLVHITVKNLASADEKAQRAEATLKANEDPDAEEQNLEEVAMALDAKEQFTDVDCQALLLVGQEDIDPSIFSCIQKNSMVYDGRIVVNASFQTKDPVVFAAGTCAKFSRAYGKNTLNLEEYSQVEVGRLLAEALLQRLDPDVNNYIVPPFPSKTLGTAPKVQQALLPDGYFYFHAHLPAEKKNIGNPLNRVLFTKQNDRICHMVLNKSLQVSSLTYLGKDPVNAHNLTKLLGLPSSYLNRILYRVDNNQIVDLIQFLEEPWALSLYHENFASLRGKLFDGLKVQHDNDPSIRAAVNTFINGTDIKTSSEWNNEKDTKSKTDMTELVRKLCEELPPEALETVQLQLLQWLHKNGNHLPSTIL